MLTPKLFINFLFFKLNFGPYLCKTALVLHYFTRLTTSNVFLIYVEYTHFDVQYHYFRRTYLFSSVNSALSDLYIFVTIFTSHSFK